MKNKKPRILVHSCCGPCSSYVISYLNKEYDVTILFYNPNIDTKEEFLKRLKAQKQIIKGLKSEKIKAKLIVIKYNPKEYLDYVVGYENEKEGGLRCNKCFQLRLNTTSKIASKKKFDYFTTTLTVSPHKNSTLINEIGNNIKSTSKFLESNFKKNDGYKKSIILSKKYNLYRQSYCGCSFSKSQMNKIENVNN